VPTRLAAWLFMTQTGHQSRLFAVCDKRLVLSDEDYASYKRRFHCRAPPASGSRTRRLASFQNLALARVWVGPLTARSCRPASRARGRERHSNDNVVSQAKATSATPTATPMPRIGRKLTIPGIRSRPSPKRVPEHANTRANKLRKLLTLYDLAPAKQTCEPPGRTPAPFVPFDGL
jgi:hypothetical protein